MAIITEIKKSTKNIVTIINEQIVKKVFTDELDFWTEYTFYKQYADFDHIPKLIKATKKTLHIEYIDGVSIYDEISRLSTFDFRLPTSLARFHNLSYNPETEMSLIHYDTNLNNYLIKDNKVYMIDFSDITLASPLSDVYSTLLFFCETLSSSAFKEFAETFFTEYFKTINFFITHSPEVLQQEISRFINRRENYNKPIHNLEQFQINIDQLKNC